MVPEIFLSRVLRTTQSSEWVTGPKQEPWSQSGIAKSASSLQGRHFPNSHGEPQSHHLFLLLPSTATQAAAAIVSCFPPPLPSPPHSSPSLLLPYYFPRSFPHSVGWLQEYKLTRPAKLVCHWEVCTLVSRLGKAAQAHLLPAIYPEQLLQTFGSMLSIFSSVGTTTSVDKHR